MSLRGLLPNGPHEDDNRSARHDPMDLATAAFICEAGCTYLFGWDDVACHHCEGLEIPVASLVQVKYSPFVASVVGKVVKAMGLDSVSMTATDLDKEDWRFSCDSCELFWQAGTYYYDMGYDWRALVRLQSFQSFYDERPTRLIGESLGRNWS